MAKGSADNHRPSATDDDRDDVTFEDEYMCVKAAQARQDLLTLMMEPKE